MEEREKMRSFYCYGRQQDCLNCPLDECVREYCTINGEEVNVIVKTNLPRRDRKEYDREYYQKNREKRREYMKVRYHAKKARVV